MRRRTFSSWMIGVAVASAIALTGCDDVLAEFQKGLLAADTPAYGIALSKEAYVFPNADTKLALRVINTGTEPTGVLTAELFGDSEAFKLSKKVLPSIKFGRSISLTVTAAAELAAETYDAVVVVSGANGIEATLEVSFTVEEAEEPVTDEDDAEADDTVTDDKTAIGEDTGSGEDAGKHGEGKPEPETETVTEDPEAKKIYIVTFEQNYAGALNAPASQAVADGGKATPPAPAPTREGYVFDGWYADAEGTTTRWNFDKDIVTAHITLYAKWAVWLLSNELGISREYTSYADETHYTYKYSYGAGEYEISRDGVHEHTVRIYTYDNGDVDTSVVDRVYDTDSGIIKQETVTKTETRSGVTSSPSVTEYFWMVTLMNTDADGTKTYNHTYITDNYGSVKYELYTIKDGVTLSRSRYGADATLHSTLTYTFPDIPVIRERLPKLTLCSTVYSSGLGLSNTHETCELLESTDTTLSFRINQFYSPNSLRSQSYYTYTKRTLS